MLVFLLFEHYFCNVKKAIVIVVFLFILKPILPVLEYAINYDYIVKELCENRDKPKMACNGKCHLMKELSKAYKKSAHHEFEVLFFEDKNYTLSLNQEFSTECNLNSEYSNLYFYQNSILVFHPPTV